MAAIRPVPICIGGNWWRDVTNETTDSPTYNRRDIEACGGKIPWIASYSSEDIPKEPPFTPSKKKQKFKLRDFIKHVK